MNPEPKSLKEAKILLAQHQSLINELQQKLAQQSSEVPQLANIEVVLQPLFDNVHDAVVLIEAPSLRILKVNQLACDMYGYSHDEFTTLRAKDITAVKDAAAIQQTAQAVSEANAQAYDTQHITKTGEIIDVRVNMRSLVFDNKQYFIGILTEITHKKIIERQSQENLQKYDALVNSISGIIWEADIKSWSFTYVSQQAERLLGYTPQEWMNDPGFWENHIHPDDLENALAFTKKQRGLKKSYSHEYRFFAIDGKIVWLHDIVTIILDEAGSPYLLRGVMIDITKEKETEAALQQSEGMYRSLVETAHEGIWVIDENNLTTFVNPSVENILGYTPQEMIGHTLFDFMDEAGIQTTKKNVERRKQNISEIHDFTFIHKEGHPVHTLLSTGPIMSEEGVYQGSIAGILNISERKKIQDTLLESEERYRQMFEHNKAIKFLVDPENGAFLDANPAAIEFYGYTLDEFKNMTVHDISPFAPESVKAALAAASSEQQDYFQFQHQLKSGEARDVEIYSGPINFGEKIVLYSIVHDITDRRQKEREIQDLTETLEQRVVQRTAQLEEINNELEAFAYSISHDLRAPLRAISGYSNILNADYNEELPPQAQEHLQKIDQSSKRMDQLIHDLLMLSNLGRQTLRPREINYCEMTKRIFTEQIKSFPDRNFSLTTCKTCPNINADPQLLEIMISNLIANAIKFTQMREIPQIEFGAIENDDEEVIYFVKDNGIGFNMDYADKLFNAFQRLHGETEFEGTGIGLAIVKRVIQRHNGRIWVESEPDKGTAFYFTIGENLTI